MPCPVVHFDGGEGRAFPARAGAGVCPRLREATMESWSQETFEKSLSSRCWWFTPYDDGWRCPGTHADQELAQIVAMEHPLRPLPEWTQSVVQVAIRSVPPCGHYLFPRGYLEAVSAIGAEDASAPLHSYCFAVDRDRKLALLDYCLCLDAWLAGAPSEAAAAELSALGHRNIDWPAACADLWQALGEHTETKDLLVERTLHQTRWWVKVSAWPGEATAEYGRGQYLGDYEGNGWFGTTEGNPGFAAPGFRKERSPRVQRMEARLAELTPHWHWFRTVIAEFSWPCAPKAFRYLEKLLWCIGRERPVISLPSFPLADPEPVPGFLQVEDTWPDQDAAAAWWEEFLRALRAWWQREPAGGAIAADLAQRLGEVTPVKQWLVRLLVRRLELAATEGGKLTELVHPPKSAKRGTGRLCTE